jgi:beta-xylosidase
MICYTNPVWPHYFADPFVLKVRDAYYAYGTAQDAQNFPVLRSNDLVQWESVGNALQPLTNPRAYAYWAPEVAIGDDGRFYMYYSATTSESDEHHRLRVAIADGPAGPFVDPGVLLFPDAGFTIDASPFRDPQSGRRFLYCAMDFTTDEPHGTGLAMAELANDMITVRQPLRLALRATCDWQIYERKRDYKGRVWE